MQFDDGTYIGHQSGTTDPVFWIWKPASSTTEYWVLFKPGQTGGFEFPSSTNTNVKWGINYSASGTYTSGCEFLAWVALKFSHSESDLVVHEHTVDTLNCEE